MFFDICLEYIDLKLIVTLLTAFVVAFYTQYKISERERNKSRREIANNFIKEFYSQNFIAHRIALWHTKQKILENKVSVEYIIKGYIYPLEESCYIGDKIEGQTEHQHITLYFGFFERLSNALLSGSVDEDMIKNSFQYEFLWTNDLFKNLYVCGNDLFKKKKQTYPYIPTPYFINSIKNIENFLQINDQTMVEISHLHYKLKDHEIAEVGCIDDVLL